MTAVPIPVPLTGPITINDIKAAFPLINSNSYRDYENATWYRPSTGEVGIFPVNGPIDDYDFRGVCSAIVIHISVNSLNVDIKSLLPYYFQGATGVLVYVDAGVKVGSASSGSPALTVNGFTSRDAVKIINNGFIKGAGGNGGGAGGYTSYETEVVDAPVADPGNPGQTIPQPDPQTDNPGLYGYYVRGTRQNQPLPVPGTGTTVVGTYFVTSSINGGRTPYIDQSSSGTGVPISFQPYAEYLRPDGSQFSSSEISTFIIGNVTGSHQVEGYDRSPGIITPFFYYENTFELLAPDPGYHPKEYWVFRAGRLTYHSVEQTSTSMPSGYVTVTSYATPPTEPYGDYQGSMLSHLNDGTYVAAYNIPGITTQKAVSHAGSGSDSGENGGTALFLNYPTTVVNNGSIIGGGGGGGAGAGGSTYGGCCGCGSVHYSGGAGGGGAGYTPGNNATETVGGAGASNNGTTGGNGGNPGQPGQGSSGGGGGNAGYAIQNSNFVNGGVGSIGGTIIGRT